MTKVRLCGAGPSAFSTSLLCFDKGARSGAAV
jgi:hypothetical protein